MSAKEHKTTIKDPATTLHKVLLRYVLITGLYIALIFTLPVSAISLRNLGLDSAGYRLLLLGVALPSFIAWLAAFIGYAKLHEYANSIQGTNEGQSYKKLATGCTWLAWSLPLTSFVALVLSTYSYRHSDFHASAIIISNYVSLLLPLIAFIIIGSAARLLTQAAGLKFNISKARWGIVAFAAAGISYCYFTFSRFDLSSFTSTNNPYFLPIWLMILTITVPYMFAWFTGVLAGYEIFQFSKKIRGVLYKQALQLLVAGIVIVVVCSIALQYINSASPRTGYLLLNYKLVAISCFRIIAALGFVLIGLGATKLKKIEEV